MIHGTSSISDDGAVASADAHRYHLQSGATFDVHVNDEAETASEELGTATIYESIGGPAPANFAAHASLQFSGPNPTEASIIGAEMIRDRSEASESDMKAIEQNSFLLATLGPLVAEPEAKKKWRNGACVEVKAAPASSTMAAKDMVHITATPRQKVEMKDLTAPVVATLAGPTKLDPVNTPVKAPASFAYTAGASPGDIGKITLTSTSRRGIGSTTVAYTVCADKVTCAAGTTLNKELCKCLDPCDPANGMEAVVQHCRFEGTAYTGLPFNLTARAVWSVDHIEGARAFLTATGTAEKPSPLPNCDVGPLFSAIAPAPTSLQLDFAKSPPEFSARADTSWTLTGTCSGMPYSGATGATWFFTLMPIPFELGGPIAGSNQWSTFSFSRIGPKSGSSADRGALE